MRFQRVEEWIVEAESEDRVRARFGPEADIKQIGTYTTKGGYMYVFEITILRDIHESAIAGMFPTMKSGSKNLEPVTLHLEPDTVGVPCPQS